MENKDKKKLISIIITLVIGIALGFSALWFLFF